MRVKISYTVEFDDVPKIVNDKLSEVAGNLERSGLSLKPDLWDRNWSHLEKLEHIDSMRKVLMTLDAQLADCYSILAGYNKALADSKIPQEQPELEQNNG